jgi:hypothetical protein
LLLALLLLLQSDKQTVGSFKVERTTREAVVARLHPEDASGIIPQSTRPHPWVQPALLVHLLPFSANPKNGDFVKGEKRFILLLLGERGGTAVDFVGETAGDEGDDGVHESQLEVGSKVNEDFILAGREAEGGFAIRRIDEEGEDGLWKEGVAGLRGVALVNAAGDGAEMVGVPVTSQEEAEEEGELWSFESEGLGIGDGERGGDGLMWESG